MWRTFLILTVLGPVAAATRPNIIFILADDLGFNDVSFHGSKEIPTPNLDALAYDGIILNNYYVQPICTPTRSALLTGRYPIHTGMEHSVILGSQPWGLGLEETLLPQYLKEIGYKTHMIGKWHIGFFAKQYTPLYRGFDTHFGYYLGSEDYWDHTNDDTGFKGLDFRDQMEPARNYFGQYSTEIFTQRAQKIIRQHNASEPMLLYLPFQAVHGPREAPYRFMKKMSHINDTDRRQFAAMVSALDEAVGNLTETLHEQGLLNNSLIIFSSDNGGPAGGFNMNYASNWPLRGVKELLWEGGTRGAGFVWSPLLQKHSYISNQLVHVTDWLPSILKVAGYDMSKLPAKHLDGMNVLDALSTNTSSPRTEILLNIDPITTARAIRVGNMKLIHGTKEAGAYGTWIKPDQHISEVVNEDSIKNDEESAYFENTAPQEAFASPKLEEILRKLGRKPIVPHPAVVQCGPKPVNASANCDVFFSSCLYDISKDPCEYNNLADQMPDVVKMLEAKIDDYKKGMVRPRNKQPDPQGDPSKFGGVWSPWVELEEN